MSKIMDYLGRIAKALNSLPYMLASLAIIAVVVAIFWFANKTKDDNVVFGFNDSIDVSPTLIDKMQSIGQWEFLAINDEELIDTVRKGFFGDDELVRIYYGTLRIGIDFKTCSKEWISNNDDSIVINIPEMKLLDYNFIDEARTRSFFETGKWSNKDRQDMYERARQRMISRCINEENMLTARNNAKEQIERMLTPIAAPKPVRISFE